MSLDYIRTTYGVPATRGGRIRYTGGPTPTLGTITGTDGGHLMIKLDGLKHSNPFHPTWEIEYLANVPTQSGGE